MILPEIQYELSRLQKNLKAYGLLSAKTENEVVVKQSGELAWNIFRGLKAIMPEKGAIRAERLAALKAGKGVHVRAVAFSDVAAKYGALSSLATGQTFLNFRGGKKGRGKVAGMATEIIRDGHHLNLQALAVERELAIRESARGFSAIAVPRPEKVSQAEAQSFQRDIESRFGFRLSYLRVSLNAETKHAELRWLGRQSEEYQDAVQGLSKAKQQKILKEAVEKTNDSIEFYIRKKLGQDIQKCDLN